MPSVFISHSSSDRIMATRIAEDLRSADIYVWLGEDNIAVGDSIIKAIQKGLHESEFVAVLLTPDSVNSGWVQNEWECIIDQEAKEDRVIILPLKIKNCDIPLFLKAKKCADFSIDYQTGLKDLINSIKTHSQNRQKINCLGSYDSGTINTQRINFAKSYSSGTILIGRDNYLIELNKALEDRKINVVQLVAWGGVGKTTLVNHWIKMNNYHRMQDVYVYSFYIKDSIEGEQVSTEDFFTDSLKAFGDTNPEKGSLLQKAERLAELIQERRTILCLDGLESLQYFSGEQKGKLKDIGLKALLKKLAASNLFDGLCIVTTRVELKDILYNPNYLTKTIYLQNLLAEDGARLLQKLGVNGTEKELKKVSIEFDNHALTIDLLGKFLVKVFNGDLRKRDLIPSLTEEPEKGGHAIRVLKSYEQELEGTPALDILHILGLFNRPVEKSAFDKLMQSPSIEGLTTKVKALNFPQLKFAINELEELHLILKSSNQPDILDCHPLIREYFNKKLKVSNNAAWRTANDILFEYYRNIPTKYRPDTTEEMEPLFISVIHGCQASRYKDTFSEVFFNRISRGGIAYSLISLGAISSNLQALSYFFKNPYSEIVDDLALIPKSIVLEQVSHNLKAMGRIKESLDVMLKRLSLLEKNPKTLKYAANAAGSISTGYILLGKIEKASKYAKLALTYADLVKDFWQKLSKRTTLARVLHLKGELDKAKQLYIEAEEMLRNKPKAANILIGLQGYRYCDLLLDQREYLKVYVRAQKMLILSQSQKNLLDTAHNKILLGKVLINQELDKKTINFINPLKYLTEAVEELREAGTLHELPDGLLARAMLYRLMKNFNNAWRDIREAIEIVEVCNMDSYGINCFLESSHLCLAENKKDKALKNLSKAKKIIQQSGYHRRDVEINKLSQKIIKI